MADPLVTSEFMPWLTALRPRQWTKNLIVFAAPLFGFSLSLKTFLASLVTFSLFCCLSSSFYLFNDLADVESDRQHPVKCKRPIAAGLLPIPIARSLALFLLTVALIGGFSVNLGLGATLVGYAILQVNYNLWLKQTVLLDIIAIATGFILRAYAGGFATHITLSTWFVLCTAMLALFLGIEKRKAELHLLETQNRTTRLVLKSYSLSLLNRMEGIITPGIVMSYALWSTGPAMQGASTPWMLLTLPFVLYGIFRYQLLSELPQNPHTTSVVSSERPEEILLTDLPILYTLIGWICTILIILLSEQQGLIQ